MARKKICVMASGTGTTFKEIASSCRSGVIDGNVMALITDKPGSGAAKIAESIGISVLKFSPGHLEATLNSLKNIEPDLVVLAGFLKILPQEFIREFSGKIINIHPSLLPAFGGKGMYGIHVQEVVISSGTKITGCTAHFVTDSVDAGPVIAQETVPVMDNDTPQSLQERVHRIELRLYVEVISALLTYEHEVCGNRVAFKNRLIQ